MQTVWFPSCLLGMLDVKIMGGVPEDASTPVFISMMLSWHMVMQAIADSPYETRDTETAGLFYVNDYCYYMWWLAAAQSKDKAQESPGTYLIKVSTPSANTLQLEQRMFSHCVDFKDRHLQL